MNKSKILLCLALALSGVLPGVCAFPLLGADASVTDTPKFSELVIPEPPAQHKPWIAPTTDLPTNLISGTKFLFDLGLADPRHCEYREFEVADGNAADQSRKTAHGWILPERSGSKQPYAIGWDGLVYPTLRVGKKVNLKEDIIALLRTDELWRKAEATNKFADRVLWRWNYPDFLLSQTNMTAIKVALLLRLGEGKLAREYWQSWRVIRTMNVMKEDANDPFRELSYEWTLQQFLRGVHSFMFADDALALVDFRQLNRIWPALEKETSRRGFWRPRSEHGQTTPYFALLKPVPELLADEERRKTESPHQSVLHLGLDKFPDKSKRIAALISDLDQVCERQRWFPGSAWMSLAFNSEVAALIAEGDGAIDPLLDCLEKDHRLTRSVDMGNDSLPYRIVPVQECAQAALDNILKVHFDSPGDYRAYWQKYQGTSLSERWYQTLLDDQAGRKQWMQAAGNLLARTDGKTFYLSHNAPIPNATNHYSYVAESLRSKSAPSVGDLFLKRALEIASNTNFTSSFSSQDCWTFQDAADLGLMLAEWDAKNARSALPQIIQRCPALYYDRSGAWSSGCSFVPVQFAKLVVTLANLGDTTGLDRYAKWVRDRSFNDLHDALPMALLPLGYFPNYPPIKEASVHLFRPENGDWRNALENENWRNALLNTRLLLNGPFRLLILSALTNKTKIGTITFRDNKNYEVTFTNGSRGGMHKPDSFAPKIGDVISFRVCDDVAARLSRIDGLPALQLYWPEEKRDEAVASIVKFLQDNGDNLKLKPAQWPMSNDD